MRGGKLRHPIIIQKVVSTRNSFGEYIQTWETFKTTRAAIEITGGGESVINNERKALSAGELTIRYIQGVNTTMRILYGSKTYEIDAIVDTDERHKELIISVTEYI